MHLRPVRRITAGSDQMRAADQQIVVLNRNGVIGAADGNGGSAVHHTMQGKGVSGVKMIVTVCACIGDGIP